MDDQPLKTYIRMHGSAEMRSAWVEFLSPRYAELAEKGWQVVPFEGPTSEEVSAYWQTAAGPETERLRRVERLAEKLMVASYGAGLPLQGEDVRCVVRVARLFYQEIENPTEPAAAPPAAEEEDA